MTSAPEEGEFIPVVVFGKRSVTGAAAQADADGPLIRITGNFTFGKIVVHRSGGSSDNPWIWWWENRHNR